MWPPVIQIVYFTIPPRLISETPQYLLVWDYWIWNCISPTCVPPISFFTHLCQDGKNFHVCSNENVSKHLRTIKMLAKEIKISEGESKQRSIRSFERWLACLLSGGGGFYDGENKGWGEYLCSRFYFPQLCDQCFWEVISCRGFQREAGWVSCLWGSACWGVNQPWQACWVLLCYLHISQGQRQPLTNNATLSGIGRRWQIASPMFCINAGGQHVIVCFHLEAICIFSSCGLYKRVASDNVLSSQCQLPVTP